MRKVAEILDPQPDGSLHLPVPKASRDTKIKVTATLDPVSGPVLRRQQFGSLAGKIWMAPVFNASLDDFKEFTE